MDFKFEINLYSRQKSSKVRAKNSSELGLKLFKIGQKGVKIVVNAV